MPPAGSGPGAAARAGHPPDSHAASASASDGILAAERDHLRASREFLGLMRTDVLSLRAMGGDPVSEEYLKADLYRRAEALNDLPDTPLFFGRLDSRPGAMTSRGTGEADTGERDMGEPAREHFHVGRRHVHDPQGSPVVIDWRGAGPPPVSPGRPGPAAGPGRRGRVGF